MDLHQLQFYKDLEYGPSFSCFYFRFYLFKFLLLLISTSLSALMLLQIHLDSLQKW